VTLRAIIERFLSPHLGYCYRCNRPWRTNAHRYVGNNTWQQLNRDRFYGLIGVRSHTTYYSDAADAVTRSGSGCFPLCENCWSALTPPERLPYYEQLLVSWEKYGPVDKALKAAIRDDVGVMERRNQLLRGSIVIFDWIPTLRFVGDPTTSATHAERRLMLANDFDRLRATSSSAAIDMGLPWRFQMRLVGV
jgi:hypothetical protein